MKAIATNRKSWIPKHDTFKQPIENLYDLVNRNTGDNLADYNDATTGIQKIIQEAIDKKLRLRAMGGEWSFSKVAATDGILLNTRALNISFFISKNSLDNSYKKSNEDLYFAQCGNSILEISDDLKLKGRSFITTGASNGQTIAGALSTGTHGSPIDYGSFSNFTVGLHIITGPNKHIYLQKKSYKVVNSNFTDKFGAELISDDALFNAALINFGCFGIIHGVMIETCPLFLYEAYRIKLPIDAKLKSIMKTLNFNNSALPHGSERPTYLNVVVNPYDKANEANVTVMYTRPYKSSHKPVLSFPEGKGPGDELAKVLSSVTTMAPVLVPTIMNTLMKSQYKNIDKVVATHAEMFSNTDLNGRLLSCAVGAETKNSVLLLETFMKLNDKIGPFAGVVAFRFIKGTSATLGFTRYDNTCIFEMDGAFNDHTNNFCKQFSDELQSKNIPHTFHWGKVIPMDKSKFEFMYGKSSIESWIKARNKIMENEATMRVFENEFMVKLGLDKVLPSVIA